MDFDKPNLLVDKIINDWNLMLIPLEADIKEVAYEYGEDYFEYFLGKSFLEVDESALDTGSAMLFMKPNAALYYLASYMLAVCDNLPKHRRGEFVLDQMIRSHLFNRLEDPLFIQDLLNSGINEEQSEDVREFINMCIDCQDLLGLDESQCAKLNEAKEALKF